MTGALIAGIGGNFLSGIFGSSAQKRANQANIQLNRENRSWLEKMENSAYQRAVVDLKAAGLNPMLAYSQGGANTPGTSAATVQPEDAFARSVSSASDKAMQALALTRVKTDNEIAQEKLAQERIATDNLRTKYGSHGVAGRAAIDLEMDILRGEAAAATSTANIKAIEEKLRKTDAEIRDIELQLARSTFGYSVSSARDIAKLKNQEVNLNEIRNILMRLDIPEKQAMADWFSRVGEGSPMAKATMSIGQWLHHIFGDRR